LTSQVRKLSFISTHAPAWARRNYYVRKTEKNQYRNGSLKPQVEILDNSAELGDNADSIKIKLHPLMKRQNIENPEINNTYRNLNSSTRGLRVIIDQAPLWGGYRIIQLIYKYFSQGGVVMVNLPTSTVMSNLRSSLDELRDSL
jgi:hypothetical protein